MSLLDDNITVDIIDLMHSLIPRYLKAHGAQWNHYIEYYKDIKMYYKIKRDYVGEKEQIAYDGDDGSWYLMWDCVNQIIYVTKWVDSYHRYINNLSVLMHYDKNKNLYITLKDVIDEFTRY